MRIAFFIVLASMTALLAGQGAPAWHKGDLLVGVIISGAHTDIVSVNPTTGRQTVMTNAVPFASGLAFSRDGDLFIADSADNRIYVCRATNTSFQVLATGPLVHPLGLVFGTNGLLYTTVSGATPGVVSVDPTNGTTVVVASGGYIRDPVRIALDADGTLVLRDGHSADPDENPITFIRIDPVTAEQTVISSRGLFRSTGTLAMEPDGHIVAADQIAGVIRIDAPTGRQELITSRPALGVAVEPEGTIFFTSNHTNSPGVYRVDPPRGSAVAVSIKRDFIDANPVDIIPVTGRSRANELSDLVPCEGPISGGVWESHSEYVSAVVRALVTLRREQRVTADQAHELWEDALRSSCGRRRI